MNKNTTNEDDTEVILALLESKIEANFNERMKGGSDNPLYEMQKSIEMALSEMSEIYDIDEGILKSK